VTYFTEETGLNALDRGTETSILLFPSHREANILASSRNDPPLLRQLAS